MSAEPTDVIVNRKALVRLVADFWAAVDLDDRERAYAAVERGKRLVDHSRPADRPSNAGWQGNR
jgi:hypothetical protein